MRTLLFASVLSLLLSPVLTHAQTASEFEAEETIAGSDAAIAEAKDLKQKAREAKERARQARQQAKEAKDQAADLTKQAQQTARDSEKTIREMQKETLSNERQIQKFTKQKTELEKKIQDARARAEKSEQERSKAVERKEAVANEAAGVQQQTEQEIRKAQDAKESVVEAKKLLVESQGKLAVTEAAFRAAKKTSAKEVPVAIAITQKARKESARLDAAKTKLDAEKAVVLEHQEKINQEQLTADTEHKRLVKLVDDEKRSVKEYRQVLETAQKKLSAKKVHVQKVKVWSEKELARMKVEKDQLNSKYADVKKQTRQEAAVVEKKEVETFKAKDALLKAETESLITEDFAGK